MKKFMSVMVAAAFLVLIMSPLAQAKYQTSAVYEELKLEGVRKELGTRAPLLDQLLIFMVSLIGQGMQAYAEKFEADYSMNDIRDDFYNEKGEPPEKYIYVFRRTLYFETWDQALLEFGVKSKENFAPETIREIANFQFKDDGSNKVYEKIIVVDALRYEFELRTSKDKKAMQIVPTHLYYQGSVALRNIPYLMDKEKGRLRLKLTISLQTVLPETNETKEVASHQLKKNINFMAPDDPNPQLNMAKDRLGDAERKGSSWIPIFKTSNFEVTVTANETTLAGELLIEGSEQIEKASGMKNKKDKDKD